MVVLYLATRKTFVTGNCNREVTLECEGDWEGEICFNCQGDEFSFGLNAPSPVLAGSGALLESAFGSCVLPQSPMRLTRYTTECEDDNENVASLTVSTPDDSSGSKGGRGRGSKGSKSKSSEGSRARAHKRVKGSKGESSALTEGLCVV